MNLSGVRGAKCAKMGELKIFRMIKIKIKLALVSLTRASDDLEDLGHNGNLYLYIWVKKAKDVSERGAPEWRALLQGEEFTDDDDGIRRVITDVIFSHEDDARYARRVIKGEKDIKKNHDYTILRQVFDMAREGGDDWVEDRFYKGKKIE